MKDNSTQTSDTTQMLMRVQCTSTYGVRWADSSYSSCGEREKEAWIPRPDKYADADHIELSASLIEDDYCGGGPSFVIDYCYVLHSDGRKREDRDLGEKLIHLIYEMWEHHPPIL